MSKSSPKSESTQQSTTNDNKIVADNGSVAASGGSTINFLSKDVAMAALETATDLGKASISQSGDVLTGVLALADRNAAVTEASRIGNNNLAQSLAETAISNVKESAQSDQIQLVTVIAKYGAMALAGLAAVALLFAIFRKKPSAK